MPFYTWLRPGPNDNSTTLKMKQRASKKIRALRQAIEAHIDSAVLPPGTILPSDASKVLRIATWNLREFDSASYGFRTREAKSYIAEILSYFDLIALQEIRRDLGPLEEIRSLLGPGWSYVATDVTEGSSGNMERMAFLFNTGKVWFRDVAGELTLPDGQKVSDPFGERFRVQGGTTLDLPGGETIASPTGLRTDTLSSGQTVIREDVEIPLPNGTKLTLPDGTAIRFAKGARVPITASGGIDIPSTNSPRLPEAAEIVLPPDSLVGGSHQFARTPFIASFQSGWLKLNLAVVHILYGEGSTGMKRRTEEIARLTALLADRAKSDSDSDADSYFIALGDFNIVGPGHMTMQALQTNDFHIPAPLQSLPGSNVNKDRFYDQIALWRGQSKRRKTYTSIIPYRAGVFDYFETVYREDEEAIYKPFMKKANSSDFYSSYRSWRTYQMSDHLPMWVELRIDFAEEYLAEVDEEIEGRLEG